MCIDTTSRRTSFSSFRQASAALEYCLDLPGEGMCHSEQAMSPTAALLATIYCWVIPELGQFQAQRKA